MPPTNSARIQPTQAKLNLNLPSCLRGLKDFEHFHPSSTRHGSCDTWEFRLCSRSSAGTVRGIGRLIAFYFISIGIQPNQTFDNVPLHFLNIDIPSFADRRKAVMLPTLYRKGCLPLTHCAFATVRKNG